MPRSLLALLVLLTTAGVAGAQPGTKPASTEVVVLTSFPKELFEAYKQAFEQKTPGAKVVVKQQQTNQAVTYLRETRARPEADIFWVSAVDAFQTLKADGLLEKVALPRETLARIPAIAEARRLASAVPLDARRASDKEVNAAFKDKPDVKSRMETEWDTAAKSAYARARELAEGAPSRIQ